jgi:hypothetical protein
MSIFLINSVCTSFLRLKIYLFQPTGVFDSPTDWSQYKCVHRKYSILLNWVTLLNRSELTRVWVQELKTARSILGNNIKPEVMAPRKSLACVSVKKNIFSKKYDVKVVNGGKEYRYPFNICSPWDLRISSNSFWAPFWGKDLNNPATAYLNHQPFIKNFYKMFTFRKN